MKTSSEGLPDRPAKRSRPNKSVTFDALSPPKRDAGSVSTPTIGTPHPGAPSAAPLPGVRTLAKGLSKWKVGPRYAIVQMLGSGSYGEVAEAMDTKTGARVAIKRIPDVLQQETDAKRIWREIFILRRAKHSNIISLRDIVVPRVTDTSMTVYLVFEYVDTDLYKLIMSPQYLETLHIQTFLYQMLVGLLYIHSARVIHRDIKPANILINEDCTLRICDFGLSRCLRSEDSVAPDKDGERRKRKAPTKVGAQLTKHVVTRWYRPPELILLQDYSLAVDVWSIGCIFGELLNMREATNSDLKQRMPLFPGKSCFPLSADNPMSYSDRLDQLNVIFAIIGTPSADDTAKLQGPVKEYLQRLPSKPPRPLKELFPAAPEEALDLLSRMLMFDPAKRCTINDALEHPFLAPVRNKKNEIEAAEPLNMDFAEEPMTKDELKGRIESEIAGFLKDIEDGDAGATGSAPSATEERKSEGEAPAADVAGSEVISGGGGGGGGGGDVGSDLDALPIGEASDAAAAIDGADDQRS